MAIIIIIVCSCCHMAQLRLPLFFFFSRLHELSRIGLSDHKSDVLQQLILSDQLKAITWNTVKTVNPHIVEAATSKSFRSMMDLLSFLLWWLNLQPVANPSTDKKAINLSWRASYSQQCPVSPYKLGKKLWSNHRHHYGSSSSCLPRCLLILCEKKRHRQL